MGKGQEARGHSDWARRRCDQVPVSLFLQPVLKSLSLCLLCGWWLPVSSSFLVVGWQTLGRLQRREVLCGHMRGWADLVRAQSTGKKDAVLSAYPLPERQCLPGLWPSPLILRDAEHTPQVEFQGSQGALSSVSLW
jgi:hypothetical protein